MKESSPKHFKHIVPYCKGKFVQDGAELVCSSCGACYAILAQGNEPKTSIQSIRSFHRSSLGSSDAYETAKVAHLRPDTDYKREVDLIDMIERIGTQLELPIKLKTLAAKLALKMVKTQSTKKVPRIPICVYSIIQVCRVNGAQRSLNQVLEAAQNLWDVDKQKLYRDLNRVCARADVSYASATPELYINQILNKVQSSSVDDPVYLRAVYLRARDIADSSRMDWQGKSPLRVATFCIHLADSELGHRIGINRLCSLVGIDPEILRSYKSSIGTHEHSKGEVSVSAVQQIFLDTESRSFRTSLNESD